MTAPLRRDLRIRFEAAVRRGIERADREVARIQPTGRQTAEDRRRAHARLVDSIFPRSRHVSDS